MTFAPSEESFLRALGQHLDVYADLESTLAKHGLVVRSTHYNGCCFGSARHADTITCHPRADDHGRAWFFTSWGKPIAEAVRVIDAAVAIHGYLIRHDYDPASR